MTSSSAHVVPLLQMGIANRDIKLENTLLMDLSDTPVLKLCDFGYSKDELCASISKTMCGESLQPLPPIAAQPRPLPPGSHTL